MPITYPLDLTVPPKREIKAGDLMSLFQVIADKFNAGIVNGDLSPSAALDGSKIATRSIPANRLVAADITTAEIGARQVKTANIDLLAVTAAEIANTTILEGKVKFATFDWTPGGTVTASVTVNVSTGFTKAQVFPVAAYFVASGVPSVASGKVKLQVYHDVATNLIHLMVSHADTQTVGFVSLAGMTFRFIGIYVS